MTRFVQYALGVLLVGVTELTRAAPVVTVDFAGVVAAVSDNVDFALNGTIPVGASISGSLSYDAGAPASLSSPTFAFYPALTSVSVDIGGGARVIHQPHGRLAIAWGYLWQHRLAVHTSRDAGA